VTGAILALILVLSILAAAILQIVGYELAAKRNPADDVDTISTWWHRATSRLGVGGLFLRAVLGGGLTGLFVFLLGDLALELW
jgi:hypothetical protein